jgi:dihydroorotate dehydrogenase (NAD+) catalytic subunit
MSVDLAGLPLANPVVTASGTCGYGPEYASLTDLSRLGAFTTKSVTLEERPGNEPPRIAEVEGGLINAIGLANVGLERFISEKVPDLRELGCPVIVNVAGHRAADYVAVCERLDTLPEIAALELNVSCPNVADGLVFGCHAGRLRELVEAVRDRVTRCKLIVKLTPNVTDIRETARAAIDGGADILSMINTYLGMSIDIDTWRPRIGVGSGGVSGPGIRPMAVHLVHQVYRDVGDDACRGRGRRRRHRAVRRPHRPREDHRRFARVPGRQRIGLRAFVDRRGSQA